MQINYQLRGFLKAAETDQLLFLPDPLSRPDTTTPLMDKQRAYPLFSRQSFINHQSSISRDLKKDRASRETDEPDRQTNRTWGMDPDRNPSE